MSDPLIYTTEDRGGYVQHWMCPPPAPDQPYRVTESVWRADYRERWISAWEPTDAE